MSDETIMKPTADVLRITVDVGTGDYETRAVWRHNADGTTTLLAIRTIAAAIRRAGGAA